LQELKKLQEQFAAEQGAKFGIKPSPIRPLPARKPLGQSSNANIVVGTPTSRVFLRRCLGREGCHLER